MPKSHYDTLGIKKSAGPSEVKRAYRKRARVAHPDKGGTNSDMADVNRAYDCLIDPARRLTYDETGMDSTPSANEAIRSILLGAFASILDKNVTSDCIGHVRKFINDQRDELDNKKQEALKAIKFLQNRRKKIRSKTKENVFHLLIDQQIKKMSAGITGLDIGIEAHGLALKELDNYESDDEAMIVMWSFGGTATSQSIKFGVS